jgi:hypothetical protein
VEDNKLKPQSQSPISIADGTNRSCRISRDQGVRGTSRVTPEAAATTEFSPMVTPPVTVAPAAIQIFFLIAMGLPIVAECRPEGSSGRPAMTTHRVRFKVLK